MKTNRPILAAVLCVLAALAPLSAPSEVEKTGTDTTKASVAKAPDKPAWLEKVNTGPPGPIPELPACRVDYTLSWNGAVKAGQATAVLDREKEDNGHEIIRGSATAASSGVARLLWKYDCELESLIDAETLRPQSFKHREKENKETKKYQVAFQAGRVKSERFSQREGEEAETKTRTYKLDDLLDLLSCILYARSLPLNEGEEINMVVFPFDAPYLVTLKAEGKEKFPYNGEEVDSIRTSLEILKINKDLTLKEYKKLKSATMWVSDDEFRLPLEIRTEIFVGSVRATLVDRKFLDGAEADSPGEGGGLPAPKTDKKSKPGNEDSGDDWLQQGLDAIRKLISA